jgi:branched-chain amino acid transport system ATP-binding protein
MSDRLLEVVDLEVRYGAIPAVRDANLHVQKGEIVAVVGPNGAGKTTLLRAIAGLERASKGRVEFGGRNLSHLAPEKRVGLGIAMVPQGRRVFAESTVEMNLWAGAFRRTDRKQVEADTEGFFEFFPALKARRNLHAGMLSGGEQQMLALARAAMSSPKVLLLDEPSMGLAPIMVAQIFGSLAQMSKSGVTMLLVEQNVARALEIADRVYVLVAGEMVGSDRPASEVSIEELASTFLGLSTKGGEQ